MNEKKELLPVAQMAEAMAARPNKRLGNYKAQSDQHKGEELEKSLANAINGLKRSQERGSVDLYNVQEVEHRTLEYLEACQVGKSYPSIMGLCAYGFGISRRWLNKFLSLHPETETAQFLETVKDTFADTLTNAALFGNADTTQVIFQLKNHFGHADRIELEPIQPKQYEPEKTIEQIAAEYDALPDC